MTGRPRGRTIAALATTIILALTIGALSASARTFDFTPNGSLILNPLAPQFTCAMQRALRNRPISCSCHSAASLSADCVPLELNPSPRGVAIGLGATRECRCSA